MTARLVAVALLGLLLLDPPILGIFREPRLWGGLPALPLYLFLAWGAVIALVAAVLRRGGD
ncbi:hypothetical protein EDC57_1289 [Inmirania thermothiophila]|uniref:DUF3311 domain-containing protein n=1 Tax=Inmirania thermothiophila TaxID=1750597 RepID=A0A3N1XZU9_9GAMM|nr:hypothetical protein EDC57_1289 [Inmirania thermothiophila]